MEKTRAPGSYTSLQAAKEAAHRCLFDAGCEREWFKTHETLEARNLPERTGLAAYAVAEDGTELRGWDIPREPDENVVVRAVFHYGANYLVSVINQELEAVQLTEAAMKIL